MANCYGPARPHPAMANPPLISVAHAAARTSVCGRSRRDRSVGRRADCEWRTHGKPATLFRKALVAARHDKRHAVRTSRRVTRAGPAREGGGCQHAIKVDREFDVLAPTLTLTSTELVTARPSAFIPGANRTPRSPTSHATPVIDGASPISIRRLSVHQNDERPVVHGQKPAGKPIGKPGCTRHHPSLTTTLTAQATHPVSHPGGRSGQVSEASRAAA